MRVCEGLISYEYNNLQVCVGLTVDGVVELALALGVATLFGRRFARRLVQTEVRIVPKRQLSATGAAATHVRPKHQLPPVQIGHAAVAALVCILTTSSCRHRFQQHKCGWKNMSNHKIKLLCVWNLFYWFKCQKFQRLNFNLFTIILD